MKKTRSSNIELLRIIAMIFVVVLHYLGKSGTLLPWGSNYFTVNTWFAWGIEAFALVAVNVYVLIGGYFLITGKKIDFKSIQKELWLLLLSGMAMGVNWILLFEAYKHTTISIATLSYYFAPVIVMLVCPILFREKITKKQLLCFVMSIGLLGCSSTEEKKSQSNVTIN